jgi:hypothetical protein
MDRQYSKSPTPPVAGRRVKMQYKYHATQNPEKVVLSSDEKVSGWCAPSAGLGATVVGHSEILMSKADAMAFLTAAKAAGHTLSRGKDVTGMAIAGFQNRIHHN